MSFRYGLFALLAVIALGAGMFSAGSASADRGEVRTAYVAIDGGGADPRGADDFASVEDGGTKQICETGPKSTTCVGNGWLMAGVCKAFGGDIVAGDPGGDSCASSRIPTRTVIPPQEAGAAVASASSPAARGRTARAV